FLVPPWASSVKVEADSALEAMGPGKVVVKPADAGAHEIVITPSSATPTGMWTAKVTPGRGTASVVRVKTESHLTDARLEPGAEADSARSDDKGKKPSAQCLLEVPAGSKGFSLECTAGKGGDVDLYVRRGEALPAKDEENVADYIGVATGESERLALGGTE